MIKSTKIFTLIIQLISIMFFSFIFYINWYIPVLIFCTFIFTLFFPYGGNIIDVYKNYRKKIISNKEYNEYERNWLISLEYQKEIVEVVKANKRIFNSIMNEDFFLGRKENLENIILIKKFVPKEISLVIYYFSLKLEISDTKEIFFLIGFFKQKTKLYTPEEAFYILINLKKLKV